MAAQLNIPQERELHRLLQFERDHCATSADGPGRAVLPYLPNNRLQAELIEKGVLELRRDGSRGPVVVISSDGYSYFAELQREEYELEVQHQREMALASRVSRTAIFCVVLGVILGFVLGHFF